MSSNITVDPSSNASLYRAIDRTNSDFGIMGRLRDGVLSFVVEADKSQGSVSGREFFNAMMEHFDPVHVTALVGDWTDSDPALTANLDTFNARILAGDTPELAASRTWTGQRAKDWGYTEIEIVRTLPLQVPGQYKVVMVYFKKP